MSLSIVRLELVPAVMACVILSLFLFNALRALGRRY